VEGRASLRGLSEWEWITSYLINVYLGTSSCEMGCFETCVNMEYQVKVNPLTQSQSPNLFHTKLTSRVDGMENLEYDV